MTKRIAFVLPNLGGGGAERVALTLIQGLLDRGHAIDLVLLRAEGELLPLVPPEVRIFDLKAARIRNAVLPLARYLREQRPDAVQARMWPLTAATILAARLSGSKSRIVVSDHNRMSTQYGGSPASLALLKLTIRLLYPLADARLCVSAGCADDLARLSGLRRDSFLVVNNPLLISPTEATTSVQVDELWPSSGKRILTVGSLKVQKNHELLLRAFALLRERVDAQLMILGEGPLRPKLEKQAQALGIAGRVTMPGFSSDPLPVYESADLFVLSSDYEGFGNVLVEALHAGLPIVSTDCPSGPRDILDDGGFGILVPVGEAEALAQAMADALDRPHDAQRARDRARQVTGESLESYLEVLAGPGEGR